MQKPQWMIPGKNLEVILRNTSKGGTASQFDNMDKRAVDFATLSEKDGDTYLDVALSKSQKMDDIRVLRFVRTAN